MRAVVRGAGGGLPVGGGGRPWSWNTSRTGWTTGRCLAARIHWVRGQASPDVSEVPPRRLVAPAVVLDFSARVAADPDFLLSIDDVTAWPDEHGPLPSGGWLLYRTGWDERGDDADAFANGGQSPGIAVECARWRAGMRARHRGWGGAQGAR